MNNEIRHKGFTSSQIYRLMGSLKNGKPTSAFYSYIDEVKIALYLGRMPKTSVATKSMLWGQLMEVILFEALPMTYRIESRKTLTHHEHPQWLGTPDVLTESTCGEIKCFEPLHFGQLSIALNSGNIEVIKEKEPQVYWQVVSNCVLSNKKRAEIITFMPRKSHLEELIEKCSDSNFLGILGFNASDFNFLTHNDIETLPYLPNTSKAKSLNQFEFDVPKKDIEFITERVKSAIKLLNNEK